MIASRKQEKLYKKHATPAFRYRYIGLMIKFDVNKSLNIELENTHLPYAVFKIIAVTLAATCRLDIPVLLNTLNELCAGIAKLVY